MIAALWTIIVIALVLAACLTVWAAVSVAALLKFLDSERSRWNG
jgi:hypothetical protein